MQKLSNRTLERYHLPRVPDRYKTAEQYWNHHYATWWMEDFFTILTASVLFAFGVYFLVEITREGHKWWAADFWTAPLPPPPDEPTGTGGERAGGGDERTPLKK